MTENIFLMTFSRNDDSVLYPGQFLSILHSSREKILRRPFSVFSYTDRKVSILVKRVGGGTDAITQMQVGCSADILCPLGKGFTETLDSEKTLFIAGGIGIAGIYSFIGQRKNSKIIFGDREGEFGKVIEFLKIQCLYASEKQGKGRTGRVTDFIEAFDFDTIVACGPKKMLKAVKDKANGKRYLAVCEEIMACGVGLCNGCMVKYDDNTFCRVCADGPVLDGNRIVYD
ncbi:MAG: hypothetical protein AB7T10_00360 [bacterium]